MRLRSPIRGKTCSRLQQAEAMAVMNSIIASDILITSSGALIGIRDIKVIDTMTDDLYDPPQA